MNRASWEEVFIKDEIERNNFVFRYTAQNIEIELDVYTVY